MGEFHPEIPVAENDGFREVDRGNWVGLTPEEIEAQYPGSLEAHQGDLENWRGNEGESMGDVRDRVLEARDTLLDWLEGVGVSGTRPDGFLALGLTHGALAPEIPSVADIAPVEHGVGGGVAVVVAHLFPIRAILADALGKPLEEWSDIAVPTGSISLVEYGSDGGAEVLKIGLRPDSVGE